MNDIFVIGCLLFLAIGILLWDSTQEGFQNVLITGAKCAEGYTFFNDKHGNSMCCRGRVNPITHECMNTTSFTDVCAFSENIPDPRDPSRMLSSCSETIRREYASLSTRNCPKKFPFYAKNNGVVKCCMHSSVNNGSDCSSENLRQKDYCIVTGVPLHEGIATCGSLQLEEKNVCPSGFQSSKYILGEAENTQYNTQLNGYVIPMCTNFRESCMTPAILNDLKSKGLFTNKKTDEWKYSCSAWERRNIQGDQTFTMDTSYP